MARFQKSPYLRRSVAVRNPPPKSLPTLRRWKGIETRASPFHPRRCADCMAIVSRPQSVDARNTCFPLPSSTLRELQIANCMVIVSPQFIARIRWKGAPICLTSINEVSAFLAWRRQREGTSH
ncbi:hypothetical protein ZEAMMB73_Zm00001d032016 [Zea mays]|uniref:Uncharacterized protein n=1 Tax=Zea mays TaxID=4577 RepID=A0A1D6KN32_MAIZE|nr:hypothetical protein ZEAMMB73_Zm00001d032016 [Zea mays]